MDKVMRFLAYNGKISVICANTTSLVEEIRKLHDLTPTTTAVMGRFATICGMMGYTDIKENNDSITVQINGKGPVGSLVCVVRREDNISKIKAYIQDGLVELPLKANGKLDVGGAVGKDGYLNILKKSRMSDTGYNGLVPLISGEIAEDFTSYFANSEQKATVLALGVLVNKDGVQSSGGYMINLMPDATEEEISKIEATLENIQPISSLLLDEKNLEEIAKIVTGDENIQIIEENISIEYDCDCNREKFEKGLISLGEKELRKIILEDGKANVVCHFCNKEYDFTKSELEELLNKAK